MTEQNNISEHSEPVETFGLEDTITRTPVERLPSYRKKLLRAAAFTLICCGATGAFLWSAIHAIYKSHDVRKRFVTTEGAVLESEVKTGSDSDGNTTYEPLIKYSYIVGGREYSSTRYAWGSASGSKERKALDIVRKYPPGKKITVWYDPREPSQAVLSIETSTMWYVGLLFLQPFVMLSLAAIAHTVTIPYRFGRARDFLTGEMQLPWAIPRWPAVHQSTGKAVLYSRGSLFKPFAVGYGLTCFLGLIIIGVYYGYFLDGMVDPGLSVIACTFAIALGAGATAMLLSYFRSKEVFEFDENLASLHFKSSYCEFTVSFAEIDHWFLDAVVSQTFDIGGSSDAESSMASWLSLMTTDGAERSFHLFPASDGQSLIAEKVALEFAKITAKPFAGVKTEEEEEEEEEE